MRLLDRCASVFLELRFEHFTVGCQYGVVFVHNDPNPLGGFCVF